MTLEVPPEGEQLQGKYEQVMFGALQSREEYFAERERFSQLAFQECSPPVPVEKAHEIFDTRKFLMSLAARYASEKFVLTEDFHLILENVSKMLTHEDLPGFIPFIIRSRAQKDADVVLHHPNTYLWELICQRFINFAKYEVFEGYTPADISAALDTCSEIHAWNTKYYHQYPAVGVLFDANAPEQKIYRAGEQANHLVFWRGIPFKICSELIDYRILDSLDESARSEYLTKLCAMCLDELFDRSYFAYSAEKPEVPRYMERLPRTGNARDLLRIIIDVYGDHPAVLETFKKVRSNEYQQFSKDQLATLEGIFFGEEELV